MVSDRRVIMLLTIHSQIYQDDFGTGYSSLSFSKPLDSQMTQALIAQDIHYQLLTSQRC